MKLAIAGKMGSGKTTLAEYLVNNHGFTKMSFADGVREVAVKEFGATEKDLYGETKNRKLLQEIGESCRQKYGENYWINQLLLRIESCDNDNIVVDDVRYYNEFVALKDAGFVMIRIEASEDVRRNRIGQSFKNSNHASETDLDNISGPLEILDTAEHSYFWDYLFINEGLPRESLEHLAYNLYTIHSYL